MWTLFWIAVIAYYFRWAWKEEMAEIQVHYDKYNAEMAERKEAKAEYDAMVADHDKWYAELKAAERRAKFLAVTAGGRTK